MFEKQGGRHETQHILFEGIWLDIQTRVGTPHKIQRKSLVDSWVGCGWKMMEFDTEELILVQTLICG